MAIFENMWLFLESYSIFWKVIILFGKLWSLSETFIIFFKLNGNF